jgi:hypothetical protein
MGKMRTMKRKKREKYREMMGKREIEWKEKN